MKARTRRILRKKRSASCQLFGKIDLSLGYSDEDKILQQGITSFRNSYPQANSELPDNAPKSLPTSEPAPTGFLSYVSHQNQKVLNIKGQECYEAALRPCDFLLFEYRLLLTTFPQFPENMMKFLLLKERGNSMRVHKSLTSRGWPKRLSAESSLTDSTNEHFTTDYYWGKLEDSYYDYLQGTGTFFTAMEPPRKYCLCYKTPKGDIIKRDTKSPVVEKAVMELLSLKATKTQPPISPESLVPFLFDKK